MQAHSLRRAARGGFTLVELLAVVAIIGVLVGLLLPAVQVAREAGRRNACMNNVKQLAMALHNYHDAKGRLPYARSGSADNSAYTHAWTVIMLPFIEEISLYQNFAGGPYFGIKSMRDSTLVNSNPPVFARPVPVWNCPTRGRAGETLYTSYATAPGGNQSMPGRYGWCGDYALNLGTDDGTSSNRNTDGPFSLPYDKLGLRFKDVTDGLSKTVFGGEKHVRAGKLGSWASNDYWDNTFYSAAYTGGWFTAGRLAGTNGLARGSGDVTADYTCFGSDHPGIAVMFFGDGAVSAVETTIAGSVLSQLGTRAGGENTGDY